MPLYKLKSQKLKTDSSIKESVKTSQSGHSDIDTNRADITNKTHFSTSLFANAFYNNPNSMTIYSLDSGKIVEVNDSLLRMIGGTREGLLGKTPDELGFLITNEDRAEIWNQIQKKGCVRNYILQFKKGDGEIGIGEIFVEIVEAEGSKYLITTINDVTNKVQAELSLKSTIAQAEELSQFKTALLSNINHEIRTPLNIILGISEILSTELRETKHEEMIKYIMRSSKRLHNTLESIIHLSKLQANLELVHFSKLQISSYLKRVIDRFEHFAKDKNLFLRFESDEEALCSILDEYLLIESLSYLVDNAIKFTNNGGIIILLTSEIENNEKFAVIKVIDTGIGISKDMESRIFEEFRQGNEGTMRSYEGSGLGLTLAKRMVELMKGRISVTSKPNHGTEFILKFHATENI
jgi:PAS domain S-box-containing protein